MVPSTQLSHQQMDFMLSCSYYKHIHDRITQQLTENHNFWRISCQSTIYLLYARKNSFFWDQHPQQNVITVMTLTILHSRLGVISVTDIHDITKILCNRMF